MKAVPGRRAVVFGRRVAAICLLTASAAVPAELRGQRMPTVEPSDPDAVPFTLPTIEGISSTTIGDESVALYFHFHVCVIDGMFSEDPEGSVQFHEATHLTASDWGELQHTIRHRVLRYFHCHGLLERHVTDDMLTWQASGGFSIDASVYIPARDRAGLEAARTSGPVPEHQTQPD